MNITNVWFMCVLGGGGEREFSVVDPGEDQVVHTFLHQTWGYFLYLSEAKIISEKDCILLLNLKYKNLLNILKYFFSFFRL